MPHTPLHSPIPSDVKDATLLSRSVAQGIYSSLDPRRSEIYFTEALVTIEIYYGSDPRRPTGRIVVNPEQVTIKHTVDPFAAEPGKTQEPRHVRWVVRGLAETDKVVIRPKTESPEHLFNYLGGSLFEIPFPHNSVASGLPFIPHFESMATAVSKDKIRIVWRYSIEVWRAGKKIFEVDPEIHIQGDYKP